MIRDGENNEIRIEIKFKNNRLYKAITARYSTLTGFCTMNMISYGMVIALLNLSIGPKKEDGQYRKVCLQLSDILEETPETLFPSKLYILPKKHGVVEASLSQLPVLAQTKSLEDMTQDTIIREKVKGMVDVLPTRERTVIIKRYWENHPQRDIAKELGVSTQAISAIEKRAIKKIRIRNKTILSIIKNMG